MMDEHLGDIGHRIDKLERRIQRRAGGHLVHQVVPFGVLSHTILDSRRVAREQGDQDAGCGIDTVFANHQVRGQVSGIPAGAQGRCIGSDVAKGDDESGALALGYGHVDLPFH
ncbi:hypothetical protein GCM10023077_02020 [Mycolicibacterium helvum]